MSEQIFFAVFIGVIFLILAFDLGVFQREKHEVSFREALVWTSVWFGLSIGFYFFLKFYGHWIHNPKSIDEILYITEKYRQKLDITGLSFDQALQRYRNLIALEYLTGYFIEYSLSADNLFVILLIFRNFGVRKRDYKTILIWGILGAVIFRFTFIFLGAELIQRFHFLLYLFGAFLMYSGFKVLTSKKGDEDITPEGHPLVRLTSKYLNVFPRNVKSLLMFRHPDDRKTYVTPLFIVLLLVEFSDIIFAVDSVPAIFSITLDPYIVFFSNIFAILGLRSLFFLLAKVVDLFHYLTYGLGILLIFIGLKLVFEHYFDLWGIQAFESLMVVVLILALSIAASLIRSRVLIWKDKKSRPSLK
ncbi:membrane protein [Thermaurantimonas aggregans]|uniref:Membrane protein n=1 Tax=Thermaurantimonas aggregans TaxID=2173829 RepID=A0A401XLH8_9FLAO|nr:TerC/Alx family metal homeostasis membrane protein [Thermaurantimonas aggregans]MCX8149147.1 TerC/Alx family metal homeostasis membrane protein [Thermaurantimonas aggregans]GCD77876.1 membrane protein [Thermaurantimonas aggregans]